MPGDRWLPLSARSDPEHARGFEVLRKGVPEWLCDPLLNWIGAICRDPHNPYALNQKLRLRLQVALRVVVPDMIEDIPVGAYLDIIDYVLSHTDVRWDELEELELALSTGGSAWKATPGGLIERVDQTLQAVTDSVLEARTRPAEYLSNAWKKAWSREPDASGAYRDAVRAVESAYAPIVSPRNKRATLGTIIRDIKSKPSRLRVRLEGAEADANTSRLVGMLEMLWKSQLDRHGTADGSEPLNVSIEEARDAVALAATLTYLAQQGGVTGNGN